jgi:uncharacterized protein YggT (Ycf19 family)
MPDRPQRESRPGTGRPRDDAEPVTQRIDRIPEDEKRLAGVSGRDPVVYNVNAPRQEPESDWHYHVSSPYHNTNVHLADRINQFIWYALAILQGLLAIRVFLRLIAANPANPFASFIYSVTEPLTRPFVGIVGTPRVGDSVLELDTLIAMVVYILLFYAIVRLVELISDARNRP